MKHDDLMSELFDSLGVFFAFSNEQFEKAHKEGVKYTNCGSGMICPTENVKQLFAGLDTLHKKKIEYELRDNSREQLIDEALGNYECFYTWDISDAVESLEDHGITRDEILARFNATKGDHEE